MDYLKNSDKVIISRRVSRSSRAGFIELKPFPFPHFPLHHKIRSPPSHPPTMAAVRKKLLLNTVSVDIGCGSCRKPKTLLSQIFCPKSRARTSRKPAGDADDRRLYRSPSSFSESKLSDVDAGDGLWKIGGVSVAVEKDSSDPYVDFRQSMLQMILENEIYTQEGLRELLSCFLQLNSPCNHGIIIRAFAEIWDGVFCGRSTAAAAAAATAAPVKRRRAVRSRAF